MRPLSVRIISLLFILVVKGAALQSGSQYSRSAVMNGNNVKTVFTNSGIIGAPIDTRPRGAWLKESNGYIGDNSVLIGIELPIKDYTNDGKADTIHSVITAPVTFRPASSHDTDDKSGGGIPFGFMPTFSSINPSSQSVAMSNDPSSWPASWGGVWKGINGDGNIIADLETYFQMDDRNDHRFSYPQYNPQGISFRPDTSDTTRKGQGITVEVRYLQFNNPWLRDVLFRVYDISNESSYDYGKVTFGYLMGNLLGVTGSYLFNEYDDDYSVLYKKESVIISGDFDNNNFRNPFWRGPVGKTGEAFAHVQVNEAIGSYVYFTPSFDIPLGNDEAMWKRLAEGTYSVPTNIQNDTTVLSGKEGDYQFGSKYFSLKSGEKKRIVSMISYGYDNSDVIQKILIARVLATRGFDLFKTFEFVNLPIIPGAAKKISGTVGLAIPPRAGSQYGVLYFSPDAGKTWQLVKDSVKTFTLYQWNTATVNDCAFGVLRFFTMDSAGRFNGFFERQDYFAIDNAGNGSPFISLVTELDESDTVSTELLPLSVLAGDPDNTNLTAKISYSIGGEFIEAGVMPVTSDSVAQNIVINVGALPNSEMFRLKIELTDGNTTRTTTTESFRKKTLRNVIANSNVLKLSGNTEAQVSFGVVDKSKTTSDTYIVSFADTVYGKPKTVSVFNKTKNISVLNQTPMLNNTESPIFDGLRLSIADVKTGLKHFTMSGGKNLKTKVLLSADSLVDENPHRVTYPYRYPGDYSIVYGIRTAMTDLYPAVGIHTSTDTMNFAVIDHATKKPIPFFCQFYSTNFHNIFLMQKVTGLRKITWLISVSHDTVASPVLGDTLTIFTSKGLSIYDSLQIKDVALGVPGEDPVPEHYSLSQNYPNPFNPSTTIRFSVPQQAGNEHTTLTIYDLLGREIATLVNEQLPSGSHSIEWNGRNAASGIYFYRLRAGNFSETKKMVLMK